MPSTPSQSPATRSGEGAFASGMRVTPHVHLVERLALGGMGELWLGHHSTLATEVVVKFVQERYQDSAVAVARFRREARAAARIHNPHVVNHFDHGLAAGRFSYIIMERLHGRTLGQLIDAGERLGLEQAVALVEQVASALDAAHRLGIVHRDIKPDNLFLCDVPEGIHVKVLDFGVATHVGMPESGTLTAPGTLVGTPNYLSPELVLEKIRADEHADLWALAAVAYEALTGSVAYGGETVGAVCTAIARGLFTPPSQFVPSLGPEVDAWFSRALHRNRNERPGTALQLAASFARLASGAAVPADGASERSTDPIAERATLSAAALSTSMPPSPPRRRRRPKLAALAALIALSAIVVASQRGVQAADVRSAAAMATRLVGGIEATALVPGMPTLAGAAILEASASATSAPEVEPPPADIHPPVIAPVIPTSPAPLPRAPALPRAPRVAAPTPSALASAATTDLVPRRDLGF